MAGTRTIVARWLWLEGRIMSLCVENQIWGDLAWSNEATTMVLWTNLKQQLASQVRAKAPTVLTASNAVSYCCRDNKDDSWEEDENEIRSDGSCFFWRYYCCSDCNKVARKKATAQISVVGGELRQRKPGGSFHVLELMAGLWFYKSRERKEGMEVVPRGGCLASGTQMRQATRRDGLSFDNEEKNTLL
ncbi:hypothetical protein BHE74_00043152 [Ensete ventricosum]|nr:hypothetical protein GW17_00037371 [Ensete ventricosum]RWW50571.1 hypothetical protein BHE74_00043152 [Ensete ventricosum]RZS01080.1 hypothetical protein BHM03_00030878 [Ensete ventricosum]